MRAFITGGTGFIGSRLALALQQDGQQVVALGQTNNEAERQNKAELEEQGIDVVLASVTDREALFAGAAGCQVIYHLAAAQHEANVPDQHFWDVNVEGTENVLDAGRQAGVTRFIHGSTIGVYGSDLSGTIDEDSPLRPDNIYGRTKLAGEERVRARAEELPVVIVRIAETYGPGDRRLLKLFKGIKNNVFFMTGNGQNLHQLIYVDDLIEGMRRAAASDRAVGQTFVLAGARPITTREMVDTVAGYYQTRVRWQIPMWLLWPLATLMEKSLKPLGIQPPLHRRRLDFFRKSFSFTTGKAQTLLNFTPQTEFSTGVARTAAWYERMKLV